MAKTDIYGATRPTQTTQAAPNTFGQAATPAITAATPAQQTTSVAPPVTPAPAQSVTAPSTQTAENNAFTQGFNNVRNATPAPTTPAASSQTTTPVATTPAVAPAAQNNAPQANSYTPSYTPPQVWREPPAPTKWTGMTNAQLSTAFMNHQMTPQEYQQALADLPGDPDYLTSRYGVTGDDYNWLSAAISDLRGFKPAGGGKGYSGAFAAAPDHIKAMAQQELAAVQAKQAAGAQNKAALKARVAEIQRQAMEQRNAARRGFSQRFNRPPQGQPMPPQGQPPAQPSPEELQAMIDAFRATRGVQ